MHCLYVTVFCVSEAGVLVKTYVEKGMLVPDHVMTRLMLPRLEQLNSHSWLLDGKKNIVYVFNTITIDGFYFMIHYNKFFYTQLSPSFVLTICSGVLKTAIL